MRDWSVVVTTRCAEACARQFGLSRRETARRWLYDVIRTHGKVTDQPPGDVGDVPSESGYYMVADDTVVMPLTAASDGTARWIANDCTVVPSYRRRFGTRQPNVDPSALSARDLVGRLILTRRAVERFQQAAGADPNPDIAQEELRQHLERDVRVVAHPPGWCPDAPEADFYLVSGDEYLLPVTHRASAQVFDAVTVIHRAHPLFGLQGPELAARCRLDRRHLPAGSSRRHDVLAALSRGGRLSSHRPTWARRHAAARFWLVFTPSLAAPVAWRPHHEERPLVVLDLARRRPLLARLGRRGGVAAVLSSH